MSWDLHRLFVRHAREIERFLRRRGHTAEAAADITQDTFLRVLASPPGEASTVYNPKAYLFRVSRNLSVDLNRRERVLSLTDIDSEEAVQIADPAPSAETVVYSRQCLALTSKALAELPDRTRKAFEMHRLGDRTLAEVAAEIGVSQARAWGLIREAYRHLMMRMDGV